MAKLHGLVYIAVGLFVSIASWRIDYERFVFFFFIGWVFVSVGAIKIIFSLIKKRNARKESASFKAHTASQNLITKYCSQCGSQLKHNVKFCTHCGNRL